MSCTEVSVELVMSVSVIVIDTVTTACSTLPGANGTGGEFSDGGS